VALGPRSSDLVANRLRSCSCSETEHRASFTVPVGVVAPNRVLYLSLPAETCKLYPVMSVLAGNRVLSLDFVADSSNPSMIRRAGV